MPEPQLTPEHCMEQEEIAESIRVVMGWIINLHTEEREALKKHDFQELERIDAALQKAAACESSLLEKFRAHIQSHRCQPPKALR